ncbi:LAETG motif-containing sortase-dependent surface protein [Streptomyces sp. NPDC127084]|uniref:LAETG motif-containing sortase-dependent surface protein n=1 Tax=Streptomyces sp. NPDC127084 TaxID=3347133 RepID=UPI003650E892
MRAHLSSRSAVSVRSAVAAAAVLLTVVTPVAVPGVAFAQAPGVSSVAESGVTTILDMTGAFELGQQASFEGVITNGTTTALKGQKGLITVAYGKHADATSPLEAVPADASKVVVEHLAGAIWERLPLSKGKNNALQAEFTINGTVAPGAKATERFRVTIDRSIPADLNFGEFAVGAHADGTGMNSVGFSLDHKASENLDVRFTGLSGTPELTTGGKPVEFNATVTNNTGKDRQNGDFFFIGAESGDLDPTHVTLERRDSSGVWTPVRLGEQDQAILGNLDSGVLKKGQSRDYTLRLGLTKHFPKSANRGDFALDTGNSNAVFDFTVKHQGGSGTTDPAVDRTFEIATSGLGATTPLAKGGAAKEFTATVRNKGNIPQQAQFVVEITDQDVKRKLQAGEVRLEQYVKAAADGWKNVRLLPSTEGGHLMARLHPNELDLAPGGSENYRLRLAATSASKVAKGFTFDMEVRAALSSHRVSRAFTMTGASSGTASAGTPSAGTVSANGAATPQGGRMAETGGGSSTPLLIGAAGVLVATGAAWLLIARRRAV